MNSRTIRGLVLGGVLAVLLAVLGWVWRERAVESTDDAQIEADVVTMSARLAGQVKDVAVHEHQRVKAGDVLLVLDGAPERSKLAASEAAVGEARADRERLRLEAEALATTAPGSAGALRASIDRAAVSVDTASSDIALAKVEHERAAADAELALARLTRSRSLANEGVISGTALEDAEAEARRASTLLASSESRLSSAESQKRAAAAQVGEARGRLREDATPEMKIAIAKARVDAQSAHVTTLEAEVASARADVDSLTVRAPCDGEVANLTAFAGSFVAAGEPVAQVVPAQIYVRASFKETQISAIEVGMAVDIDVDALGGKPLHGTVESVAPGTGARFSALRPDNASGNFVKVVQRVPVRIALIDPPALGAGLSATVDVKTR